MPEGFSRMSFRWVGLSLSTGERSTCLSSLQQVLTAATQPQGLAAHRMHWALAPDPWPGLSQTWKTIRHATWWPMRGRSCFPSSGAAPGHGAGTRAPWERPLPVAAAAVSQCCSLLFKEEAVVSSGLWSFWGVTGQLCYLLYGTQLQLSFHKLILLFFFFFWHQENAFYWCFNSLKQRCVFL